MPSIVGIINYELWVSISILKLKDKILNSHLKDLFRFGKKRVLDLEKHLSKPCFDMERN